MYLINHSISQTSDINQQRAEPKSMKITRIQSLENLVRSQSVELKFGGSRTQKSEIRERSLKFTPSHLQLMKIANLNHAILLVSNLTQETHTSPKIL